MTDISKLLFITASGLALSACGSDKGDIKSAENEVVEAAKAPPPKPKPPTLNYCHGGEYNPKQPFKFVYFNLAARKGEMNRIRAEMKAQLDAMKDLPKEAKADAIRPHLAKTQVLAAVGIQPLADQIQRVSATLCNFEIYEKDKCTGTFSRSVRNPEIIEGVLAYNAPDGRGQDSRVIFSSRDYSDITIEGANKTSHWSRNAEGVESFSFKDPTTETRWTENPDCSGEFSQKRKNSSVDASWTSPKAGPLVITYKQCSKGVCYEGTL